MSRDEKLVVYKGDESSTVRFGLETQTDLTNYTCKISVWDFSPAVTSINGTSITDKITVNSRQFFTVKLTDSQTTSLDVGNYRLFMKMIPSGSDPGPFTEFIDIEIRDQAVPT